MSAKTITLTIGQRIETEFGQGVFQGKDGSWAVILLDSNSGNSSREIRINPFSLLPPEPMPKAS